MSTFDQFVDRKCSDSVKWAKYKSRDIIPLWIADTDFPSPFEVKAALKKRADHPIYGYGFPSEHLKHLFIDWVKNKHKWLVAEDDILFTPGIVPALNLCCEAFTKPDEHVLIQTPVYPPIASAPSRFRRKSITLPVILIDGKWKIDFSTLDKTLDQNTKLLILCNPHNPTGTVFSREDLTALSEYVEKHDLIVVSDEIHSDLILDANTHHIPFSTLSDAMRLRTITLMGPSKTFNLAGLGCGIVVIENPLLRIKFQTAQAGIMAGVNIFGLTAAEAAYQHGEQWLKEQISYLQSNRDYLSKHLNALPGVHMHHTQATYLAWIDISGLQLQDEPEQYFEKYGVGISGGKAFGQPDHIRINFGCHRSQLVQAVERMTTAILEANKAQAKSK